MKIILNKCYGGFDVSKEAYMLYAKKKGIKLYTYSREILNGDFIYKKNGESFTFCYFIKDFGDVARISSEEYSKYNFRLDEDNRIDETLVEVIEELKDKASGRFGDLEIIEIPDNSFYKIDEYDGVETIYYSNSEINTK